MINNLIELINSETIYLVANWGVIPFWLLLIFIPNHGLTNFLAISLFAGAWMVRDAKRFLIPKIVTIPMLTLTYFSGPVGLVIYWFIRIFFAKKISFDD